MDHSTHSCAHNALKFCSHCNTVWCQACKVEWRQNPFCLLNHYPTTWPYHHQVGTFSSSGGASGGATSGLTITNAPTPFTLTACAHGGD